MFFDRPDSGERAVLVHLNIASELEREDPREFEELVLSAGGDPVAFVMGARTAPHPHMFVGSGKLQEIREQVELELAAEHEVISGGIKRAVDLGVVDRVVDPTLTRRAVAEVLLDTPGARGNHGNIPL